MAGFFDLHEEFSRRPSSRGAKRTTNTPANDTTSSDIPPRDTPTSDTPAARPVDAPPDAAPPGAAPDDASPPGLKAPPAALTVSDLTRSIKDTLKAAFPRSVLVRGEVSNYRGANANGHHYFRLKDAGSVIDAVLFANAARSLKFKLAEGLEVVANARLDVYEPGGRYNLVVTALSPVGTGALELAYRQLYARLDAEGLFAPERKRPIPPYPRTLALVTSKTAAALADMLKVLRRFPFLRLIVVPVPVQGDGAADRIARALDGINANHEKLGGIDLIILGRGGGSYEDLFEFSREEVARAVARSAIPVVTGIGHEVDVAIADLVADHHAHTPTQAATFAVRYWERATDVVDQGAIKLRRELRLVMQDAARRLETVSRHPVFARPDELLLPRHQRTDDREQRLTIALRARLTLARRRLDTLEHRLARHDPRRVLLLRRDRLHKSHQRLSAALTLRLRRLESRLAAHAARLDRAGPSARLPLHTQRLTALTTHLHRALTHSLSTRSQRLASLDAQLRILGPDSVLARGFTLTTHNGTIVRNPASLSPGDTLTTRFATGQVQSKVTETNETAQTSEPADERR